MNRTKQMLYWWLMWWTDGWSKERNRPELLRLWREACGGKKDAADTEDQDGNLRLWRTSYNGLSLFWRLSDIMLVILSWNRKLFWFNVRQTGFMCFHVNWFHLNLKKLLGLTVCFSLSLEEESLQRIRFQWRPSREAAGSGLIFCVLLHWISEADQLLVLVLFFRFHDSTVSFASVWSLRLSLKIASVYE